MEFHNKLKAVRLSKNLSQKDVASRVGVSEVSVGCWENGTKTPSMKSLISLAEILEISVDRLLGVSVMTGAADDLYLNKHEAVLLSNYRKLDRHGKQVVDTVCSLEASRFRVEHNKLSKMNCQNTIPNRYIPKYSTPSAAGFSSPLENDEFEMILADESVPYDADFAVKIQGNSMNPYIFDGDTVFVKKNCDLKVGDIGIFSVDGAMYCKHYYIDSANNLILVSANPKFKKSNIFISSESNSNVKCFGKVLLDCKVELPRYLLQT